MNSFSDSQYFNHYSHDMTFGVWFVVTKIIFTIGILGIGTNTFSILQNKSQRMFEKYF